MFESSPTIRVELVLDTEGKPLYIGEGEIKHFRIRVWSENLPGDIYSVKYNLHSSYVNPVRVETEAEKAFQFFTTTYGDYSVSASFMGKTKNYTHSCIVSKALLESHPQQTPEIQGAIMSIREH